jgi:hypothetical protein
LPKLGLPSAFQSTLCASVYLLPSQAPAEFAVAWYTFQTSLLSGLLKNLWSRQFQPIQTWIIAHIPIVTGTVVSVGRAKHRTTLCPTSRVGRVTTLVCQKAELIRAGPAVTCRVSQECLSSMVKSSWPFIDGELANLLPWQGGLRQCLCGSNRSR